MRRLVLALLLSSLTLPAVSASYAFRANAQALRVTPATGGPSAPVVEPPPVSCALPWGGTLTSGAPALTAYTQSSVTFETTCAVVKTTVSCDNGKLELNGATSASCAVQAESDPYWTYVTLLLQGEGSITDSSSQPKALTLVGNAHLSGSQFKYGTGSLAVDGAGDYVDAGSSPRLAMGSADFTIETWAKSNVANKKNAYLLMLDATGGLGFGIENGQLLLGRRATATDLAVPYNVDLNWHHFAVTRSGGIARIFVDGNLVASGPNTLNYTVSGPARVGGLNLGGYEWNGYIDDFRVTTGVARYLGNFTPPTRQAVAR